MASTACGFTAEYFKDHVEKVKQKALYPSMVQKLVGIMSNSLDVSGVESKRILGKQKEMMDAARREGTYAAARARFALGNDDGAYLRSNIMPLQTSSIEDEDECRLSHKMTVDMRAASYIGLLNACQESATEKLSSKQKTIASVWKVASWMLSVPEVKAFVKAYIDNEQRYDKCDSASAAMVIENMAGGKSVVDMFDDKAVGSMEIVFRALFEVFADKVKTDVTAQLEVITNDAGPLECVRKGLEQALTATAAVEVQEVIKTVGEQIARTGSVHSLHAFLEYASRAGQELRDYYYLPKSSNMLSFAMARGLCSRRAVHHCQLKDDLHYNTPTVSCPTISDVTTLVCADQKPEIGTLNHDYDPGESSPVEDFCAFDNQEKYCSAAWAPVKSTEPLELDQSEHAIDLATASVMEHLVNYYKTQANKQTGPDKQGFLARAAYVKMKQIRHVAKVFSLDRKNLSGLCLASNFVTVPVKTIRGGIREGVLYAFDAGLVRSNEEEAEVDADAEAEEKANVAAQAETFAKYKAETDKKLEEQKKTIENLEAKLESVKSHNASTLDDDPLDDDPVKQAIFGNGGGVDASAADIGASSDGGASSGDGEDQITAQWKNECMFIPQSPRNNDINKIRSAGKAGKIDIGHAYAFGTLPRSDEHIDALSPENLEGMMKTGVLLCNHIEKLIKDIEVSKQARKTIEAELSGNKLAILAEERNDLARSRREEVWNDSMREAAISGDRLYAFVRQFSGTIHDQVDSVCVIDESMLVKYQKDAQENTKRLSMLASQKYMQLVSNVFRSVIGESGLTLGIDNKGLDGQFKVVSNTLRKQVSELASGNGSDGFFTNSTKLENLMAQGTGEITLSGLFERLRDVGVALQQAANNNTIEGMTPSAPSFDFLSSPRNSLILRYKPEAHAAMRQAFDTFSREMHSPHRHTGMYPHRKISAYELIEGRDEELCMAFASFSAHVLAHQRMFSASHAAYLGQFASRANVAAMHFTLNKLIGVACRYIMHTERPRFLAERGWEQYFRL